ncbi:hypothetical protein ABH920_004785 [Catenulispora sp. EB89]|uniref:hypothetical protein n=1 Tax=Catenulispora sp. EB89 TaxID=3156257 RepID=UPI0035113F1C
MTSNGDWDAAGTRLLGAAAEMIAAARFALAGLPVYRPLADDRGVDLLVDLGAGRHLVVQVKSVRVNAGAGTYVFMSKKHFPLEEHYALCLVVFAHADPQPRLFLVPATVWRSPVRPFVDHHFAGLKSPPEFGLNINKTWRQDLAAWELDQQISQLM